MATPTWTIEMALAGELTGAMVIGVGKIGTDAIGGTMAYPDASFTDITSYVQSFSINRGSSADLTKLFSGRLRLTLKDVDGRFNPLNPSSPYLAGLVPMRPVRVKATHPVSGTTYTLYYGFIDSIQCDPKRDGFLATLNCVDLLEWLDHVFQTVSTMTAPSVGEAIEAILHAAGWTQISLINLDDGRYIASFSADGSQSALDLIQELVEYDRGSFFITGAGVARYVSGANIFKNSTPAATFTQSEVSDITPGTQLRRIVNRQSVTKTGNAAQVSNNMASQRTYARREGAAIDSAYFENNDEALSLADWLTAYYGDPIPPATSMLLKNTISNDVLTQMLSRELTDVITASENVGGTSLTGYIAAIRHEGDHGGRHLETFFTLEKRVTMGFTIGVSTIGGADLIGY